MIDGGIVVGYLTAYLLRGARALADQAFESLLDRLAQVIERRLGARPLDQLERNPGDQDTQQRVSQTIQGAMQHDPQFSAEVRALAEQLDRMGGRQIINQVYAQTNVQAFGERAIAATGPVTITDVKVPDPTDWSDAPGWVKLFAIVGIILCVVGFLIFGYTLFTDNQSLNDPNFGKMPAGVPLAFGVFFVGFVIAAIGAVGRSLSKRG